MYFMSKIQITEFMKNRNYFRRGVLRFLRCFFMSIQYNTNIQAKNRKQIKEQHTFNMRNTMLCNQVLLINIKRAEKNNKTKK